MHFNIKSIKSFFTAIFVVLLLIGCGGGGGGGNGGGASASGISGVASKGPISGGNVTVYALNAGGSKGNQLGTATTGADGSYSVNLGTYSGNILVEVTGGMYEDEATGSSTPLSATLRAALTGVSGNVFVAVTPLTEIAVSYAGILTRENIEKGNAVVSSLVNLNITNTIPADVTLTTSQDKSQAEIDYGLMLASISQMVKDSVPATSVSAVIINGNVARPI